MVPSPHWINHPFTLFGRFFFVDDYHDGYFDRQQKEAWITNHHPSIHQLMNPSSNRSINHSMIIFSLLFFSYLLLVHKLSCSLLHLSPPKKKTECSVPPRSIDPNEPSSAPSKARPFVRGDAVMSWNPWCWHGELTVEPGFGKFSKLVRVN